MLASITHPSPSLCTFIQQSNLPFSAPQLRHLINSADAVLMCETENTLACPAPPVRAVCGPLEHRRLLSHQPLAGQLGTSATAILPGELGHRPSQRGQTNHQPPPEHHR